MKKVVTIGGGTGSYVILRGLKMYTLDITAVVSMFDSGGSTGVLRDEFGVLPPGDVRRCLLALSEGKRAEILRKLFAYRFENGNGNGNGKSALHGHSFGNLFLVALTNVYGSDIEGIKKASELLDIKGRVLPVSLDKAHIHAVLEDGTEIEGETNIDIPKHDGNLHITELSLKPHARIYEETEDAIIDADTIIICPGDLYSSLLPGIVVEGMSDALRASTAKKVLVAPLMSKWGETNGYTASSVAKEMCRYAGLEKFDYVICNDKKPDADVLAAYAKEKKEPIVIDTKELERYASGIITGDFVSESDLARHDSDKIAKVLAEL
ncbi:hypothetical protein A2765_04570 [Candidatus Kaiserbacteria bacterium RIFCSPHIGHO2_01_FULL_56_24]|uniref:Putative gluconeogenesis factor n=1 Tax=Candidatus Kaiserbacteria bacterium RIFCSPHIGHO2_01_FULL_56_24 TaxID=1798487 RepID=A0A1F6DFN7_9BACT|nr:MAG: hypothetical protein A2765_04570 [Candidatus Kaiserbacteria bacterium RIFCSPHIGHO2_01_FULL_56_24]